MLKQLPFAKSAIEQSVTTRFAAIVAHFAEQVAIKSDNDSLTYRTVDQWSNGVAQAIEAAIGEDNEPVLLVLPHDAEMIVAILGALKANKIYVTAHPTLPPLQLRTLQAQTQARLVITTHSDQSALQPLFARPVQVLTVDRMLATDCSPIAMPTADSLAGIFFTSGSTGQPKGIVRAQRNLLHRTWVEGNADQIGVGDRISMLYRTSFGASMADWCKALLNGATLCLFDPQVQGLTQLTTWLQNEAITHLHLPIQLYRQWVESLAPSDFFPALRQITPAGQQTRRDHRLGWPHWGADCCFVNRLSSSEGGLITRQAIYRHTALDSEVAPVGRPIPDKTVWLLNKQGQPVSPGESGEIVVQSRYLASGYWQQPELTAQKFVPDAQDPTIQTYYTGDIGRFRADGQLEFLGREDEMVKIRGYRVEISAVEAALQALPSVKAAAVVAQKQSKNGQNASDPTIVAYLVARPQQQLTATVLRNALANTLPAYMLPAHFILLDELPLLPNGKIDRKSLSTLRHGCPLLDRPYQAARTPGEAQIVAIWQEVLGIEPIGIHDHFLDLGGNSLLAMRIHARLVKQTQSDLPSRTLFGCTTVEAMALLITQQAAIQLPPHELTELLAELEIQ